MTSLAEVFVAVKPQTKDFEPELKKKLARVDATSAGSKAGKSFGGAFSKAFGSFGKGLFAGLAVAGGISLFSGFIKDAAEAQKIARLTGQVITSTGGAAKITAEQVADLSEAISNNTAVDDEAIQSGANLLLTFTNLRNEAGKGNKVFDYATQAITDMSAALGQDLNSSAIQLGKALNDPIRGITALSRVGVSFTAEQKESIRTFVEQGDILSAQKVILAELGKEFGGAAEAAAGPLDRLQVIFGNLGEEIGTILLPYIEDFATWLAGDGATQIQSWIAIFRDEWIPTIKEMIHTFREEWWPAIQEVWGFIVDVFETSWPIIEGIYNRINEAGDRWGQRFSDIKLAIDQLWDGIKTTFATGAGFIVNAFFEAVEFVLDGAEAMFGWVPGLGDKLREAQSGFETLRDGVNEALNGIKDKRTTVDLRFNENSAQLEMVLRGFGQRGLAVGGPVFGPGGPTADRIPAMLSNNEHIWTAKEVQAAGGHKAVELMRRQVLRGYAVGGAVRLRANVPTIPPDMFAGVNTAVLDYTQRFAAAVVKNLNTLVPSAVTGIGGGKALAWARSQDPKPYIWGGVGPRGYDCSGFMSAILNVIQGRPPHSRRGSTGTFPWPGFAGGYGNFTIGSFRGNPGHMAGTLNGVNVESRGGEGVVIGSRARGASSAMFRTRAHLRGYAAGGSVGELPFDIFDPRGLHFGDWERGLRNKRGLVFDDGGWLPPHSATLAINNTDKPERVGPPSDEPMPLRRRDLDYLADRIGQVVAAGIGSAGLGMARQASLYARTLP